MIENPLKRTVQIVAVLIVLLGAMGGVFAWKISQGPISLPQLASYIQANANKNASGLEVRIQGTTLSWQGWERYLDIHLIGTEVTTQDGVRLARLPKTAISLSPDALLEGVIAPRHIEIFDPQIELERAQDGTFHLGMDGQAASSQGATKIKLSDLLGSLPDQDIPQSYLQKLSILNGDIQYVDAQKDIRLHAPSTNVIVEREGQRLNLTTRLDVMVQDQTVNLGVDLDHDLAEDTTELDVTVQNYMLEKSHGFHPRLAALEGSNVPLSGQVRLFFEEGFQLKNLYVDVTSQNGRLLLPDPASQELSYESAALKLSYDALDQIASLEEFSLNLEQNSHLFLPDPLNHKMPMGALRLSAQLDQKKDLLEIKDFVLDLGEGPVASVQAEIKNVLKGPARTLDLVGEVLNVETSNLYRYWPRSLNDNAHGWVTTNLSDGIVPRAGLNLSLVHHENGDIVLNHVFGDMEMNGLSVDYLKPLPKVRNAQGYAKYNDKSFNITITGGDVGDIQVKRGQLDITGFELHDQTMHVDLTIEGPLRDTLVFIDREPLGFASALDLDPMKTQGFASTELKMEFLLLDDLKMDDVFVEAVATGTNVVIEDVFLQQDLSEGNIRLRVDKEGMDLNGDIVLGTIPAALNWRENFTEDTLFQSRYVINAALNNAQRVEELNLDFAPLTAEYIDGNVGVNVTVTQSWDDLGKLDAFIDLEDAIVNVPGVYWTKNPGQSGEAYVNLTFNSDQVIGVPYFSVMSGDLEASGSVKLSANGQELHTLSLSRFKAGRTNVTQATVLYSEKMGWQIDAYGRSLDIYPALNQDGERTDGTNDTDILGTISARFDQVWLDEVNFAQNVAGAITSDGRIWSQAHLTGQVGRERQQFVVDISPNEGNRRLIVKTLDAGSLLKTANLFDDMQGGELKITATLKDQEPNRPMDGLVELNDFRILDVPLLARVLNLAGLTGILDSLSGEGIGFSRLEAPFTYENGVILFKDGRTNGVSLGLTWKGQLDLDSEIAQINGTVVPLYLVNSALGHVPLIGQIFSAGEKGGGLFAWTYDIRGPLEEAAININPISGLAPGVLRKLFEPSATENAQAN